MRKFLLYSSALVVSGLLSSTAEAGCIQTPSCSSLGYTSTTACEGGLKCPWGNAWFCNVCSGEENTTPTPDYNNCKVGDILYSDMTCNSNIVASKTPIGVVFDTTNHLAVAKDEIFSYWSFVGEDLSGITNYDDVPQALTDWQGFNNTKAMYEADKTGAQYPAAKAALTYTTAGTTQGQWYIPAKGELNAIMENADTLNATLTKLAGTEIYDFRDYWSSSEKDSVHVYTSDTTINQKSRGEYIRPVINFASTKKIDVAYTTGGSVIPCKVGSILYSDKKCYSGDLQSNKTPIGIVFDVNRRLAAALTVQSGVVWGPNGIDIPNLPNYTDEDTALQDFNGKSNTAAIIAYANSSGKTFPAAEYVYDYKTEGTNAGNWYLPALGEIKQIKYYDPILSAAKAIALSNPYFTENIAGNTQTWSSTEENSGNAWRQYFTSNKSESKAKNNFAYVVPVLAF